MDMVHEYAPLAIFLSSLVLIWISRICYKRILLQNHIWLTAIVSSAHVPTQFLLFCTGLLGIAFYWLGDQEILRKAVYALFIIVLVWALVNFAKKGELVILQTRRRQIDKMHLDLFVRTLRIGIILSGLLFILPMMNVSLSGILAFGGMGAVVVGIAAKDMLANLFGGFILILDKPFRVGDLIYAPEKELEGYVEHVGWRTTKICSLDKQPISVPNSIFTTVSLQNRSWMSHRRIETSFTLRYQDRAQLDKILMDIREFICSHRLLDQREDCLIHLANLSLHGLEIFIRCYTKEIPLAKFLAAKESVYREIAKIVHENGAEFALANLALSP
ncbi:MAG: mechanosensitive ion channel family protein [Chlamydiae bacterium]|nr:mechanosensitive ion channel family protein [Chlamydiota bacterium]